MTLQVKLEQGSAVRIQALHLTYMRRDTLLCIAASNTSYWVYLCMMRTDENARGSQRVSYQVFFTIAIPTVSNLVHSVKSRKQDKCPVTSD